MAAAAQDIVSFWMSAGPAKWFAKDETFDREIRQKFLDAHEAAARGEYEGWSEHPESALALLILTDQFPRNLFRGSAHAFATDAMALAVAKKCLRLGHDAHCGVAMKQFFYMPLMHSEDIRDQELCVSLCRAHSLQDNISFAEDHRDIIRRFGRFPHRNKVFCRVTTPEEQAFLDGGGFAG
jgi:uncharacterized protein (DUF924 family)